MIYHEISVTKNKQAIFFFFIGRVSLSDTVAYYIQSPKKSLVIYDKSTEIMEKSLL